MIKSKLIFHFVYLTYNVIVSAIFRRGNIYKQELWCFQGTLEFKEIYIFRFSKMWSPYHTKASFQEFESKYLWFQSFALFQNTRQDLEFEASFSIFYFVAGFRRVESGWKKPRSRISGGTYSPLVVWLFEYI